MGTDTSVSITAGTGTAIDTYQPTGSTDHRQIVRVGGTAVADLAEIDTGGLQVSTQGRPIAAVTGTITAASSTVTATVTAAGNATITVNGTYAGVSYAFLASDDAGTTFYPVQVVREDNGLVLLADTPGTNGKVSYLVDIPGWNQVRVAASAWTSGTANVRISPGGGPFVPVVSVGNLYSGTGGATTVASTVTANTTLLAANSARIGATIFNESASAAMTVLLGAGTQSATVYTVKIAPGGYYELPFRFTGRVSGQWAAAVGNARITEFSA